MRLSKNSASAGFGTSATAARATEENAITHPNPAPTVPATRRTPLCTSAASASLRFNLFRTPSSLLRERSVVRVPARPHVGDQVEHLFLRQVVDQPLRHQRHL